MMPKTLSLRLTLWYSALFVLMSVMVYTLFFFSLKTKLLARIDDELSEDLAELAIGIEEEKMDFVAILADELLAEEMDDEFICILNQSGQVVASSNLEFWPGLADKLARFPVDKERILPTLSLSSREYGVRVAAKALSDKTTLFIGISLEDDGELLDTLKLLFGVITLLMIICGTLLGYVMISRSLAGVRQVRQAAIDIQQGELSRRVRVGNEGLEIEELARAFNAMLDHIQHLMQELQEVSQNVAHDLRSPITRIRGICETTLMSDPPIEEYIEMAATIIDEMDQLVGLINTMLALAEIESQGTKFSNDSVDLNLLIEELAELYEPLADKKEIALELEPPAALGQIIGDLKQLQRVFANLLDNAIKFSPEKSSINLAVKTSDAMVTVSISDNGPGISLKDQDKIFKRFYRVEKSRGAPGNGLGLSLAMAIVKAHGGNINLLSRPGEGSSFQVSLPRVPVFFEQENEAEK